MADARLDVIRSKLVGTASPRGCGCEPSFSQETLVVEATTCQDGGDLASSPPCREAVVEALTRRDVDAIRTESRGRERRYADDAVALFVAAGRFVEAVEQEDERLADRGRTDPLAACREATSRAGPVASAAWHAGLATVAESISDYQTGVRAVEAPSISYWYADPTPPVDGSLVDVSNLSTGATVRRYEVPAGPDRYVLSPEAWSLDSSALEVLAEAYEELASGAVEGGDRAPARAVRAVVDRGDGFDSDYSIESLADILRKHACGHGLLEDLFADPDLSDVFVSAPASETSLRVSVSGEKLVTNVRLTPAGVSALSSRFRRESGRAFSRADPTLDSTTAVGSRRVRVAGVTEPTSDGAAFAFRAADDDVWTVPRLVANGSITAEAAAVLSVAVERGAAVLSAGPRGAGKTTLLGALLWELRPTVRTVVIEDTPELPVEALQRAGRDVQALLASDEEQELSVVGALRTALRLGDGALAVGEVRGEEAAVLYEAMRVGANSEAVLGTIHGDGAPAVYERVVTDLGVSPSSFGVTDLVVTCELARGQTRRVGSVEEVTGGPDPTFESLFERRDGELVDCGRIDRGESKLVDGLAGPDERYADVREQLMRRQRLLDGLATRNATGVDAVSNSHGHRTR